MDKVIIETYAIDKDYYNFVNQLQEIHEEQTVLSGPPANIKTNI